MRRALLVLALLVGPWLLPTSPASAGCSLGTHKGGVTAYRSPRMQTASTVLYGDSITYQAYQRLTVRHPELAVDTYWGRTTFPTVEQLAYDTYGGHVPDVVVMAIGTNDTHHPQTMTDLVRYARDILPASTRLIWLNTYVESRPGWQEVNVEISRVPGIEVVDWAARNLRARGMSDRSPLLYDGVHLSCDGADAWLALVESALQGRVSGTLAPLSDQATQPPHV